MMIFWVIALKLLKCLKLQHFIDSLWLSHFKKWPYGFLCSVAALFPSAVVTKYHSPVSANNTNSVSHSSEDQKSEMGLTGLQSGCRQDFVPSRSSVGGPISFLHLESQQRNIFKTLSLTMTFLSSSSSYKDSCDDIRPTHTIWNPYLDPRLQSPICHVM